LRKIEFGNLSNLGLDPKWKIGGSLEFWPCQKNPVGKKGKTLVGKKGWFKKVFLNRKRVNG